MQIEKTFQADVTLCTGVTVKALVQAKNIFHAHKSLEWVYGSGHVDLVREQQQSHPDGQHAQAAQLLHKQTLKTS